jgi:hypothetical protein
MFYMETIYLQMAASRELAKERLRGQDEPDARPKAGSAQARSSYEAAPQQASTYAGVSPNGPWLIESWRGAGW